VFYVERFMLLRVHDVLRSDLLLIFSGLWSLELSLFSLFYVEHFCFAGA